MSIVIALLVLGIVIIFHEFGHFLLAKANGVVVEEFSVGMGPRLLSHVFGKTRYSLKLIPFGGSCMMKGEDDEDTSDGTFNSKSVWGRMSIIVAGPLFNFILAFFGAMITISILGYDPPEVLDVTPGSVEEEAGLRQGDLITSYDGRSIHLGRELYAYMMLHGIEEKDTKVSVLRDGKEQEIVYHPQKQERYVLGFTYSLDENRVQISTLTPGGVLEREGVKQGDYVSAVNGVAVKNGIELQKLFEENPLNGEKIELTYIHDGLDYTIVVTPEKTTYVERGFVYNLGRVKTNFPGVLKYSAYELKYWIGTTLESLKLLVTGKMGMDNLSGPVGVVSVIGDAYEESKSEGALITWLTMLNMVILISANLGVMNLLPLPALDGGRLIFLIIEAVRRKPLNRDLEGTIHFAGLIVLLGILLLVSFRDIRNFF